MTFQAYIDNIKAKSGKTPEDFRSLAENKGLLKPGVKAICELAKEGPRLRAWPRHGDLCDFQGKERMEMSA
ncbi:MAG: DUF4287 domain-containing protein [Terracidiphilus sp.]|jgi:hypothetical protein